MRVQTTGAGSGSGGFTLVITGSGFVPESVLQWNGQARTTTYDSPWSDQHPAVLQNFERSAAIAAAFLDWPLGPEDEMAPVFTPVTEP